MAWTRKSLGFRSQPAYRLRSSLSRSRLSSRLPPRGSKRGLKTERPAKLHLVVTRLAVLRQLRAADIERQIKSRGESGVADPVLGANPDAGVRNELVELLAGARLDGTIDLMRQVA